MITFTIHYSWWMPATILTILIMIGWKVYDNRHDGFDLAYFLALPASLLLIIIIWIVTAILK